MTDTETRARRSIRDLLDALRDGRTYHLPKGVTLYRRPAKRGEMYDRAEFRIKSAGRTGAAERFALSQAIRGGAPLLAARSALRR